MHIQRNRKDKMDMINEMDEVKKYLKNALGIEAEITPLKADKLKTLPLYITSEYAIQHIKIYLQNFLLVFVKKEFRTEVLRKHLETIRIALNTKAIAVIGQIESYKRSRLIEKKIPFIIPGKQMYLPDLLIDLKEYASSAKELPLAMPPATQLLTLYHLQVESLEGVNLKGIAERLHYDAATITRAAFYLHNSGLCRIAGTKEKSLMFGKTNRELWAIAESTMSKPVIRTKFFSGYTLDSNLKFANINALAHYTDLNDEQAKFYAIRPGYAQFIGGVNLKPVDQMEANVCIEEWKYDPALLTKTEYIDPLSLYLCFRENKNERIEMALEKLLKQIQW
jgi:hypothetical protein